MFTYLYFVIKFTFYEVKNNLDVAKKEKTEEKLFSITFYEVKNNLDVAKKEKTEEKLFSICIFTFR